MDPVSDELYNFNWEELRSRLQLSARGWHIGAADECKAGGNNEAPSPPPFYFSWRPAAGWTFLMINSYAVSVEQDERLPGHAAAMDLLRKHNPQCAAALAEKRAGYNFFDGLTEEFTLRFVPFNGGLGAEQLRWLRSAVRAAVARGDRMVIFGHLPMLQAAASPRTMLYDAEEALEVLHTEGDGHVVAVMCGHLHRGGYAVDAHGIHHVTLQSPLNFADCFGHVEVHTDRLELRGEGEMRSFTMRFPDTRAGTAF